MAPPLTDPLVELAMRVAADAHKDQCRKASSVPYLTHPASVALILAQAGFKSREIIAAALLHDVVEDSDWTIERLARVFPPKVVQIVEEASENKTDTAGQKRPWTDRKREHIEQMKGASFEARAVVLADKLHNLNSMLFDLERGEPLWDRFNAGREDVLEYHHEIIRAANDSGQERLASLTAECLAVINRIERFALS